MSKDSAIEWTGDTHQLLAGCCDESAGCLNCYAKRQAHRMGFNPNERVRARYAGLTTVRADVSDGAPNPPRWTGEVRLLWDQLAVPLRTRAPRTIFLNSLSDTFHADVPDRFLAAVFGMMAAASWHTFQVLTKRGWRLAALHGIAHAAAATGLPTAHALATFAARCLREEGLPDDARLLEVASAAMPEERRAAWPLPNVWLGVTVENRAQGVPRLDDLRAAPAALRFVSAEPLLEDLGDVDLSGIDLVIIGGEAGPNARGCDLGAVRRLLATCRAQRVPPFVKQLGARPTWGGELVQLRARKGNDPREWPPMGTGWPRELPITAPLTTTRSPR